MLFWFEFVRLPEYERTAKDLLSDDDERRIEHALVENPEAGAVVAKTGGVRKLRVALPGRGKRGSARVIYFYRSAKGRVYLLYAYAKGAAESLSDQGKREMRRLTSMLEREP